MLKEQWQEMQWRHKKEQQSSKKAKGKQLVRYHKDDWNYSGIEIELEGWEQKGRQRQWGRVWEWLQEKLGGDDSIICLLLV